MRLPRRIPLAGPAAAVLGLGAAGGAAGQALEAYPDYLAEDPVEARLYELLEEDEPVLEAERPERLTWRFPGGSSLNLYGWINYGILSFDDGRETNTYGPIDNSNSPSRIGLAYTRPVGTWTFGARVEVQNLFYSTAFVNQVDSSADLDFRRRDIRWIEVSATAPEVGTISVGQGSMATDGVTNLDLSGTTVIGYSSVGDSASGQFLRFSDPERPIEEAPQVGQVFRGFNGPRRVRLRYTTPEFSGFTAAAAYGRELLSNRSDLREEDLFDVSLFYAGDHGPFQLGAGGGYFWDAFDRETLSAAVSALHEPTGLNLTFAAAESDVSDRTESYWYAKLGLRSDVFAFGTTAASIDYYAGSDFRQQGSESTSYGFALVQNVDQARSEVWLTLRRYQYDEVATEYQDALAFYGGLRWRF
jgi:hypothetical protein